MKNLDSKLFAKFSDDRIDLLKFHGGLQTDGSGDCHGTGCSESKDSGRVIDWEDIECGDDTVNGTIKCPAGRY